MKKNIAYIGLTILSLSLLSGCRGVDADYEEYTWEEDENYNVVEMQTVDPTSEVFQYRYNINNWELEVRPDEEAPNNVVMVNKNYDDGSCTILPGTMGTGAKENTTVYDGQLLTGNHSARTLEIFTTSGIRLQYVIGYEVEDMPYIFEINFPIKDQTQCEIDAQELVSSFKLVSEIEEENHDDESEDVEDTMEETDDTEDSDEADTEEESSETEEDSEDADVDANVEGEATVEVTTEE
jgi:hypothetical protein